MKFCRYCQRHLPLEAFTVRRASPDGLSYKCRECGSSYQKTAYTRDPSPFKLRAKEWGAKNKNRRAIIVKRYADKHKDKITARMTAYATRRRYESDRDHILALGRLAANRRRDREASCLGSLSMSEWSALLFVADGHCVYCARPRPLTMDHAIPIAAGGALDIHNAVPCCKQCNSSKNARPIDEWLGDKQGVDGLVRAVAFLEGRRDWLTAPGLVHGIRVREV